MIALHRRTISTAVMALALGVAIAGCSDDGDTAPTIDPAVVGNWNAASFLVQGNDLILQGMGLSFIFGADGSYDVFITNDQGGLCDPGMTNCSEAGEYTATATQIVLDPGTIDETTLNYSISGTTMTVSAVIDGTSITAVFDKV